MSLKFSLLFNPLPPETTILAAPNSGLSLLTISSETHLVMSSKLCSVRKRQWLLLASDDTLSTAADPPVAADGGNAVGLIVNNFNGSADFTVAIALPIQMIK